MQFDYLSAEEEQLLAHQLHHGTPAQKLAARNRLVTSHLRLAYSISRKYFSSSRLPQDELAQQAALGLFAATNKFDARAK
ncbi:sigma factor, partial [Acinetobacter baumannii]